ncbi:MAG: hypothetical protein SFZ23_11755 [Planctomycetota bacterium]|nr:hypothetical protein [Planctomycetota bacterium]
MGRTPLAELSPQPRKRIPWLMYGAIAALVVACIIAVTWFLSSIYRTALEDNRKRESRSRLQSLAQGLLNYTVAYQSPPMPRERWGSLLADGGFAPPSSFFVPPRSPNDAPVAYRFVLPSTGNPLGQPAVAFAEPEGLWSEPGWHEVDTHAYTRWRTKP